MYSVVYVSYHISAHVVYYILPIARWFLSSSSTVGSVKDVKVSVSIAISGDYIKMHK